MKTTIAIVLLPLLYFGYAESAFPPLCTGFVSKCVSATAATAVSIEGVRADYASDQEKLVGPYISPQDIRHELSDLIECTRKINVPMVSNFSHWMMYVGEGHVIHVAQEVDTMTEYANVTYEKFLDVAGSSPCRINNLNEFVKRENLSPLPIQKAIQNAWKHVDETVPYNLICNNCEHYATRWKYKRSYSGQADIWLLRKFCP